MGNQFNQKHNGTANYQRSSLYGRWLAIKQRTLNPKNKSFKNYGLRGIFLCADWLNFGKFQEWSINNGYSPKLSLDRINNDKGYSPDNCRWTDRKTQNTNKRQKVRMITVRGETRSMKEWADLMGDKGTEIIRGRLSCGWEEERAVLYPRYKRGEAPKKVKCSY